MEIVGSSLHVSVPTETAILKEFAKNGPVAATMYVDLTRKGFRKFEAKVEWNGEMMSVIGRSKKQAKELLLQRISATF